MAVGGIGRGLAGGNYPLVLLSTIVIAIAQPFLLNAWTKVPANWFAVHERAMAVGLVTLANLVGTAIGMVLTPVLNETMSLATIQLIYGGVTAISTVLFLVFAREKPPTPAGHDVRVLMFDGLRHALRSRMFWLILIVSFLALGIFNGLTTWIEGIVRLRGYSSTDAGTLGAVMLIGGTLGAVIIPLFSDKERKRKRYLMLGLLLSIPGMVGLTFATESWLLLVSTFELGFFLVSTMPIAMQYASEITYPTPEGTSNGLIQLAGQASVVFVYIMSILKTTEGSFTPSLLFAIGLLVLCVFAAAQLQDPTQEVSAGQK
jgi:cyanate permease